MQAVQRTAIQPPPTFSDAARACKAVRTSVDPAIRSTTAVDPQERSTNAKRSRIH